MRLVTRADLDGLASALIVTQHEPIDDVKLVHPREIMERRIEITVEDIVANLPYHPSCGKWFAHHLLTDAHDKPPDNFEGLYRQAPSAAQLVWEYYGEDPKYGAIVTETNRFDAAELSELDVLQPQSYVLLGFTIDARSGLGDEEENEAYFLKCLEWLKDEPIEKVLLHDEVRTRINRMFEQNEEFCRTLVETSLLCRNVIFTDFRPLEQVPAGNRFLVYTLFPEANVSVLVEWAPRKEYFNCHVGQSIFNRSCQTKIGELMSRYGGGGHEGVGSAPLPLDGGERQLFEIVSTLQKNG